MLIFGGVLRVRDRWTRVQGPTLALEGESRLRRRYIRRRGKAAQSFSGCTATGKSTPDPGE